jgi:BirA family biotin operon repressor/biotin-[acetyl-CoA-carboxylase] ligase
MLAGFFTTVETHAEIDSTMERARELAAAVSTPLPALVMADVQTAGRGRRGARWWQAPGSLAASIVLDERSAGAAVQPTWSLACGVALAEALTACEPSIDALVRWPNDVEVDGRKIAGILLETAPGGRTILGIGVNTTGHLHEAPEPLRHRLTTVVDLTGRELDREVLLGVFFPRFLGLIRAMASDRTALVARYRPRCGLDGRSVTVFRGQETLSGACRGIDADGALLIDTETGRVAVASGSLTPPENVWH